MRTICLGIESTAHTFGASVVSLENGKFKFLSNESDMYKTEKGGMIPIQVAKHHENVKDKVVKDALEKAGVSMKDINLIAFSQAPGLPPCLKVGLEVTKELSAKYKLPVVPVNHCIAHLEIGKHTSRFKDPVFLFISGANTQVISYAVQRYRIFGETLDMGLGNFIDTFARHVGIGFPGGPRIAELASKSKNFIDLPYNVKGIDVAFSGMLTNLKQKYDSGKYKLEDLAFSLQEHAFAMVIEIAERAMAHLNKKELISIGGVASNSRFRKMAEIMCRERKAKFSAPPKEYVVDNAAMIAYTGLLMYKAGEKANVVKDPKKLDILPYQRTDNVVVNWIG